MAIAAPQKSRVGGYRVPRRYFQNRYQPEERDRGRFVATLLLHNIGQSGAMISDAILTTRWVGPATDAEICCLVNRPFAARVAFDVLLTSIVRVYARDLSKI